MTLWTYAVADSTTKAIDLKAAHEGTRFWVSTDAGWEEVTPDSVASRAAKKATVVFAAPGEVRNERTLIVIDSVQLKDPIPPTPWCSTGLDIKQMRAELSNKIRRGSPEESVAAPAKSTT
jgi:hypothetical protein